MCIRVEHHKRRVLELSDQQQEMIYEELRQKKVAQDETMERIKKELVVSLLLQVYCVSKVMNICTIWHCYCLSALCYCLN